MISCAFVGNTPMWHGWNSVVTEDDLPSQTLTYMEPVGKPPTRLDVVQHTMDTAIRVADECHDSYIPVMYDLAIAEPALQIQSCKSPMFDRLYVCFRAFHIKLAYFKCLGYILSGSSGDHVLSGKWSTCIRLTKWSFEGNILQLSKETSSPTCSHFQNKTPGGVYPSS